MERRGRSLGLSPTLLTLCFVVNGAPASFPEVTEETSEWVTAIGGDLNTLTLKHIHIVMWSEEFDSYDVCVCAQRTQWCSGVR